MKNLITFLFVLNFFFVQTAKAQFSGGDGSQNNPYQIATLENLQYLSENSSFWNGGYYFIQTADIDASETSSWNSGAGFTPIGNGDIKFKGYYNGQGHTIDGLYINIEGTSTRYVGLFGYLYEGLIENLGVKNGSVSSTTTTSSHYFLTGSIVGRNEGTINNCYNNSSVFSSSKLSFSYCGGIVGDNQSGTISNCYNTGDISAFYSSLCGGIAGCNSGNISNCYNVGNISLSTFTSAHNLMCGGIVGENLYYSISNCYNTGNVSSSSDADSYSGGIVGYLKSGTTNNCYYNENISISGDIISEEGTALSTVEMKQEENFSDWDFSNTWGILPGKTYPALLEVNNAPFAFADTLLGNFADLLNNDYDYETGQTKLVLKVVNIYSHTYGTTYNATSDAQLNDKLSVYYRVGELLNKEDTLWGSYANADLTIGLKGSGTSNDPFQISTLADLQCLSEYSSLWNGGYYFIQTANIDASETSNWNSGAGFTPIGNENIGFKGYYNGQGHTIDGLYLNFNQYLGFLGYFESGRIDSIGIINGIVSYTRLNHNTSYLGGIAGYNDNGTINNCYYTGNISSSYFSYCGGITGSNNDGTISNCYNTSNVSSDYYYSCGGIAGNNINGTINNCYNTGNCYNTSNVSSDYYYYYSCGGIAGNNIDGTINNCYNTGNISSSFNNYNSYSGGIVAKNNSGSISNCYNTGYISAYNCGGIVSNNITGNVSNCYYNENITLSGKIICDEGVALGTAEMKQAENFSGWDFSNTWGILPGKTYPALLEVNNAPLAFADSFTISASINLDTLLANDYDYETGKDALVFKIISKTDYSIISSNILTFKDNAIDGNTDTIVYRIGELLTTGDTLWGNQTTAVFRLEELEGSGSVSDPYQIATLADLKKLSLKSAYWEYCFIQTADIDASETKNWNDGKGFLPIGVEDTVFAGTYNGQGYTINNLYINRPSTSYIGLFGYVKNSEIKNMGIVNCEITAKGRIGGITGEAEYSTVSNCYCSGTLSGSSEIGGLAGFAYSGSIRGCYSTGTMTGSSTSVGGLVGSTSGSVTISNCYSTALVSGANYIGGLTGANWGTKVDSCYCAGKVLQTGSGGYVGGFTGYNKVSTITDCYFNSETSGQSSGIGYDYNDTQAVTGLTTAQMKQASSFSNWDFSTIWGIASNSTYPALLAVNNVLFAFADSITTKQTSINLDTLLINDYDYEMGQTAITYKVISYTADNSSGSDRIYTFNSDYRVTLVYCAGEITAKGDTLWGNPATAILVKIPKESGTINDPYRIAMLADLQFLSENSSTWGSYFIQTADIDASNTKNWNDGEGFSPVGNSTTNFSGYYNGQGYIISNFFIDRTANDIGLFGIISSEANLSNIGIVNGNISGGNYRVGGLVGANNGGTIKQCFFSGAVTGAYRTVGGLAGFSSGQIEASYTNGNVSGSGRMGGFVGNLGDNTVIKNCYSTSNVSGLAENIGGFIGRCLDVDATITNCYSSGAVSGTTNVGGFMGDNNSATLTSCYFDKLTSGTTTGIASGTGEVQGLTTDSMKVAGNFLEWGINEPDSAWGMYEGLTYPALDSVNNAPFAFADSICTKVSSVSLDTLLANDYDYETGTGALTYKLVSSTNNYSSISNNILTFPDFGVDTIVYCVGEKLSIADTLWGNSAKSIIIYTMFSAGIGTESDPFQITTIEELNKVRNYLDKHFVLMNNLDFNGTAYCSDNSSTGWEPIGDDLDPFTGSFNGKGHTINGLYINMESSSNVYAGLFGYNMGSIDSLGMTNGNVSSSSSSDYSYSGSIAGLNKGTVSFCYNTGRVYSSVSSSVMYSAPRSGGIAGYNYNGAISSCYNTGSVSSFSYSCFDESAPRSGGIAGYNYNGAISSCYNIGSISSSYNNSSFYSYDAYCGGIVGYFNNGIMNNCYNAGSISTPSNGGGIIGYLKSGTINNCFYNEKITISGSTICEEGAPLSTAKMKQAGSFSDWDFSSIWGILPDKTYPALLKINNAPFAFTDTVFMKQISINSDTLLVNDYDYESLQTKLIVKLESCSKGNIENNIYSMPVDAEEDDSFVLYYRVGEIAENDTLWGNSVKSIIINKVFCSRPGSLSADDIGNTSANLSWTESGTATEWQIEWGISGFEQGTGTLINTTSDSLSLTGLTALTRYDFYVCSVCNEGGTSFWSEPCTFVTDGCVASEQCTHTMALSDSYYDGWNGAAIALYQGGVLINKYTLAAGSKTTTITVDLCSGYDIELVWVSGSYDSECSFELFSPNSQSLFSFNDGSIYDDGDIIFTFTADCSFCYPPESLTATNITNTTADLSWTESGTATEWQIEWGESGFEQGMGIYINTNSYSLTGLTGSTDYDFYVRSVCNEGDTSSWAGPCTFSSSSVNSAPTLANETATTAENTALTIDVLGNDSDPDGDSIYISNIIDHGVGSISIAGDSIVYIPTTNWSGLDTVVLSICDTVSAAQECANDTVFITVTPATPVNNAPVITSTAPTTATEDVQYIYTVLANDPEGSTLTYFINGAPSGMTITDSIITWTPGEGVLTSGEVTLIVSDGELGDTARFTITVTPVNDAPVITSTAPTTATEDVQYTYTVLANDPEGSTLTYSINGAPSGMTITDSIITWTPGEGVLTSGEVTLIVSDGELGDTARFTITVIPENDAPVITSTTPTTATEDVQYTYTVLANDPEDSTLTYSINGAPSGMTITDSIITWTPGEGVLTSGEVTLIVSDGELGDTARFTITVTPVNDAPVITSTAPTTATEDVQYTYTVLANDPEGSTLTYSINGAPSGMTITDSIITWTPGEGVLTSGEVTLIVSDGELGDTARFTITVTPVNDAPVITSTAPTTAIEDVQYTYTVLANDPEGSTLTYSISGAPSGMTITDSIITWTPGEGVLTSGEVTLIVSDGELGDTARFTITVTPVNDAPVITSTAPTTATEDVQYTYTVLANDAEDSTLTYSINGAPSGMRITDNTITWTPGEGVLTSGEITLIVSDGELGDTARFTIAVTPVNDTPIITSTAPTTAIEDVLYTYTVLANDPEDSTLTYSIIGAPSGMTITDSIITWTPGEGVLTSGEITLIVSDGELGDTARFTITVTPENDAPVITSTAPTTATEDVQYIYTVLANDPEGSTLTYFINGAPSGMLITDSIITWTPGEGVLTSGEITLIVSDGELGDTARFTITVTPVNDAPVITSTAPTVATVGVEYSYIVTVSDPENDNLSYSLNGEPSGMVINDNVITWTPQKGETTSGKVTLTVSDGNLSDTEQFTISVAKNSTVFKILATMDNSVVINPDSIDYTFFLKDNDKYTEVIFDCTGSGDTTIVKVEEGDWMIRGTSVSSVFLTSYVGDVVKWEDATITTIAEGKEIFLTLNCQSQTDSVGDYTVSGYVYKDTVVFMSENYIVKSSKSDSKEPMMGVTVLLYSDLSSLPIKTVQTNSNGYYEFTGLCEGDYYIEVDIMGFTQLEDYSVNLYEGNPSASMYFTANVSNNIITDAENLNKYTKFDVYPNPSHGVVTIDCNGALNTLQINVYSITGQKVYQEAYNSTDPVTINLDNLVNGIYVIRICTEDSMLYASKKIVLIKE